VSTRNLAKPLSLEGRIVAVQCDGAHRFSKPKRDTISLVADLGIDGDAHAGQFVQHRYLARKKLANDRQIHLIQSELFDDLKPAGFTVHPGDLGENITTRDVDLLALPLMTMLHLGASATVELTGLRTPCGQIDRFQKGLKRALILKAPGGGTTFRTGVFGAVRAAGSLKAGDRINAILPDRPWRPLPFL
jgi:hypothetical protein